MIFYKAHSCNMYNIGAINPSTQAVLVQCQSTELDRSLTDKPALTFDHSRLSEVLVPVWSGTVPVSHALDRHGTECSQLLDGNTWLDIWQNLKLQYLLIQQRGLHVLTKHDVVEAPRQLAPRQILLESHRTRPGGCRHQGKHTHAPSHTNLEIL